jgi:hypothetical protein
MMKTIVLTSSILFGMAFGAALQANAQDASKSKIETMAVAPRSGGTVSAPPNSSKKVIPVGIPGGEAKLNAIKNGAAAAPRPTGVPTRLPNALGTVAKSCTNTNSDASNTSSLTPSDIHGAVGLNNFVVVTNSRIEVHSKTGCGLLFGANLNSFFGLPSTILPFDPRVIYNKDVDRFFVSAETEDLSGSTDQIQFLAVSKNGSGTTGWFVYGVALSSGSSHFCKQSAGSFWDYPSLGSDSNRLFIVANDFGSSVVGSILDWNKGPMLTGSTTTVACFAGVPFGITFNVAPPIVLDTNLGAIFLSPGTGSGSSLARYKLATTGGGPGGDSFSKLGSIGIPAWTAAPAAAQPNGVVLDTLDGRFQSASIQSRGLLWNAHTVHFGGAAVRVYKIDNAASASTVLASLFTSGTDRVFNGSVATGSGAFNAPIFVSATRTDPATPPSHGNAAHLVFSGLNSSTTDWLFNTIITSASQYDGSDCGSTCRWGDYSSAQVDPLASGEGWSFNQRILGTSQFSWGTEGAAVFLNLPAAPTTASK